MSFAGWLWGLFMLLLLCLCCSGKPTEDVKSCEKGGKTRTEKEQCSDASSLRRVGRETSRVADILEDCWLCLHHRNEVTHQDKRCSCPLFWGHGGGLAKSKIPTKLYVVFDGVGRRISCHKPGTNWYNLCRRRQTKTSVTTNCITRVTHDGREQHVMTEMSKCQPVQRVQSARYWRLPVRLCFACATHCKIPPKIPLPHLITIDKKPPGTPLLECPDDPRR
ncbi:uncharacterized protein LOC116604121 isoform X1 [Nematostella vectensis]|uniref:uncharacterized protein LOC116604121 isoform X2 n=1 Tax=Nematostella vectensis TaxID=45351 RepID=UPI0013904799|nr:uncharacterized protein LOC116604121 isoform X2 [Nematostella vectensis]XP_048584883.1 uncharacterized protein LOC116604121 isoform X1 [Nematostella vectensis]